MTHCFHGRRARHLGRGRDRSAGGGGGGPEGYRLRRGPRGRQLQLRRWPEGALRRGSSPATISSDLHHYNVNGPVFDLATTMSKFLAARPDRFATRCWPRRPSVPAGLLGLADRLGSVREGFLADLAVFKLAEGVRVRGQHEGRRVIGRQRAGARRRDPPRPDLPQPPAPPAPDRAAVLITCRPPLPFLSGDLRPSAHSAPRRALLPLPVSPSPDRQPCTPAPLHPGKKKTGAKMAPVLSKWWKPRGDPRPLTSQPPVGK
ncbi:MAG: hypothetical protein MZV63_33890 [Marinilabiliales bacterium]|nr:hypothetical protein [Marinilabiliales bacterium]